MVRLVNVKLLPTRTITESLMSAMCCLFIPLLTNKHESCALCQLGIC